MAVETIGARRLRTATELAERQKHAFNAVSVPERNQPVHQLATHIYHPPTIPDSLSSRPIGRHRPEYILSEGRKPVYMLPLNHNQPEPSVAPPAPRVSQEQKTVPALPRRTHQEALETVMAENPIPPEYEKPHIPTYNVGGAKKVLTYSN